MNSFPPFPQDNARIGLFGVAFDENSMLFLFQWDRLADTPKLHHAIRRS